MNQKNTIQSMIPRRWLAVVPPPVRDQWADRIVEKFKELNPVLYSTMGKWHALPEEEREEVEKKVLFAADAVHQEVRKEIRK